ncbi:hypothetical protein [Actinokineospora cianjurensis]|uniref:Uncharacterized protein n=1 Tax=Actinokineospora cianjurensis TaxID=585224 RepID=A0A421B241_9PSEU|nr:hypothetical protein [Actinokineospora cianjurensis]RLK58356.1 hypothetical protein CLV68_4454 [Actinokineospora cianjurensis]
MVIGQHAYGYADRQGDEAQQTMEKWHRLAFRCDGECHAARPRPHEVE